MLKSTIRFSSALGAAGLVSCLLALPAAAQTTAAAFVPVTDAMLQNPAPGDWLMWRRTLDGWGFSPLEEIDKRNVQSLRELWSVPIDAGNQEPTPLVYNGVLYLPLSRDIVRAYDAATGELKWEYRRQFHGNVRGGTNRNLAIWGNYLIDSGADNYMYAIDARTGELVWETKVLEPGLPANPSSGPIIANGKVIAGRQCQPGATHEGCIITAHDAATGKELWRARTIPRVGEPGDETWGGVPMEERWHVGTWMVPSYDPELDIIYIGTSVTIPAPKFILGGVDSKHLYHNSTLALDADTGKIVWYYQHLVDHWDLDHPFERMLVDTAVAPNASAVAWINPRIQPGERRKVMTGVPGKTGIVYTLDRATGEFLWARPTVFQNVVKSIDGATGEVEVDPERVFTAKDQTIEVCPGANGGKNFPAGAYSPRTNTMYVPMQNMCMTATTQTDQRDPSAVYGFRTESKMAPLVENVGSVFAVSAETGETRWERQQGAGVMSVVATAGGLVFGGDVAGIFRALDDATGEVLWEQDLGRMVSGYPVSFAVGGRQAIAVTTGSSLVGNAARRMSRDLPPEESDSRLVVFALP